MGYKILKIGRYYPDSIEQIYAQNSTLAQQDYDSQRDILLWQCMSTGDAYTHAFRDLGYEGHEIIANADILQRQWAQEHTLGLEVAGDQKAILFAQIAHYAPDILLVFAGASVFDRGDLQRIKEVCPHLRLSLVFTDAPTHDFSPFYEYDLVISNTPELVTYYAEQGLPIHHVHYGFDPRVLERIDNTQAPHVPFGFVGSVMKMDRYHNEREQLLAKLVHKTDLQVWSNVRSVSSGEIYAQRARQLSYDVVDWLQQHGVPPKLLRKMPGAKRVVRWPQRPVNLNHVNQRIARRAHPAVYGLAMYQLLHSFKVSLNVHIDISANSASSMRLYEATGVASCLLTDWKDDLHTLYEPDCEVVTYRNPEECLEKVRYLLDHEEERQRIATAGQQRTLRDHTYKKRVEQLHELIARFMSGRHH